MKISEQKTVIINIGKQTDVWGRLDLRRDRYERLVG